MHPYIPDMVVESVTEFIPLPRKLVERVTEFIHIPDMVVENVTKSIPFTRHVGRACD